MAEVERFFPGALEILQAVEAHPDSLEEKTSQDDLLRQLILARVTNHFNAAVTEDTIGKLRAKIELWIADNGVVNDKAPEANNPAEVALWTSGAKIFKESFLDAIGYKWAPVVYSSDKDEVGEGETPPRQADVAATIAPTDLKRKSDEVLGSVEKRQRHVGPAQAEDENSPEVKVKREQSTSEEEAMDVTLISLASVNDESTKPQEQAADTMRPVPEPQAASELQPTDLELQVPAVVASNHVEVQAQSNRGGDKPGTKSSKSKKPKADAEDDEWLPEGQPCAGQPSAGQPSLKLSLTNKLAPPKTATEVVPDAHKKPSRELAAAWSREAGQEVVPKIVPTRRPVNIHERVIACDKTHIGKQMEDIQTLLSDAMHALCQEQQIDQKATSMFLNKAGPDLKELYEALFGSSWLETVKGLKAQRPPVPLLQKFVLMGLLGAGIHEGVFRTKLPWDVTAGLKLGGAEKYLEQVLLDRGYELNDITKGMKGKQIADKAFQKKEVSAFAKQVARSLMDTLLPHLESATKAEKIPNSKQTKFEPSLAYLEDAIKVAITLRQNLAASQLGSFAPYWPSDGPEPLDFECHIPMFELTEMGNAHMIHATLPGIYRVEGKKKVIFVQALVVPGRRKEAVV